VVGAVVGAAVGKWVGPSVGKRDGAVVGARLGGVVGLRVEGCEKGEGAEPRGTDNDQAQVRPPPATY
jgi:uncharacterized protein YcfJ